MRTVGAAVLGVLVVMLLVTVVLLAEYGHPCLGSRHWEWFSSTGNCVL